MLTVAAGPHFCYRVGQVVEVDDALGKQWIDGRHAEPAQAPDAPAAAVPEEEVAAVDDGEKAATTGSTFKKLTGKGKGKGDPRSGNPSGTANEEPDASDTAAN